MNGFFEKVVIPVLAAIILCFLCFIPYYFLRSGPAKVAGKKVVLRYRGDQYKAV